MRRKNKVKYYWIFFIGFTILLVKNVSGQKIITLEHKYLVKAERLYNMDGGEVYVILGNDTMFLPKISQYEFEFSKQMDSLVSVEADKRLPFLIKTPRNIYYIDVPLDIWKKHKNFTFSFYKTPKLGSQRAYTFEEMSATSPAIIIPNKKWKCKYYKYEGW